MGIYWYTIVLLPIRNYYILYIPNLGRIGGPGNPARDDDDGLGDRFVGHVLADADRVTVELQPVEIGRAHV